MSVPLKEDGKGEGALVAFTLLVPAAFGVAAASLMPGGGWLGAACALVLASVGMAGSITHLAKPLRAPTSLRGVGSSWLSREIAAVSVFWALVVLWAAAEVAPAVLPGLDGALPLGGVSLVGRLLAAVVGAVLMSVIARAYKVPTRPAWMGPECCMELWACAFGAGSCAWAACCGAADLPLRAVVCACCAAGLALDVASHKMRRRRLEGLAAESDERIPLTLARYGELMPRVRLAWGAEACAVLLAVAGLWAIACVLQLVAHGIHRCVFYALPVQVRYVARLRK